jgi:hypothetical protein
MRCGDGWHGGCYASRAMPTSFPRLAPRSARVAHPRGPSWLAVAAWTTAGLLACGSNPGSVNGTINGSAFDPADAAYIVTAGRTAIGGGVDTTITMATTGGLCELFSDDEALRSTKALVLDLVGGGTVTAGQTFTVDPTSPLGSIASYEELDATGSEIDDANGMSGTIRVTAASGGMVSGSFDLMMGIGEGAPLSHVTGTFNAQGCALREARLMPTLPAALERSSSAFGDPAVGCAAVSELNQALDQAALPYRVDCWELGGHALSLLPGGRGPGQERDGSHGERDAAPLRRPWSSSTDCARQGQTDADLLRAACASRRLP